MTTLQIYIALDKLNERIDMLESRYAELETLYHELRERLEREAE